MQGRDKYGGVEGRGEKDGGSLLRVEMCWLLVHVVLLLKNLVRMQEKEKKSEAHEMVIGDGEHPLFSFSVRVLLYSPVWP